MRTDTRNVVPMFPKKGIPAFYLTEAFSEMRQRPGFLDALTSDEWRIVRAAAIASTFDAGESVFIQGEPHKGIYLIDSGRVRTYYVGPSGKELTLAYWTPGHFVGGPEVFGGGSHMWSAHAMEESRLIYLPGEAIRHLVSAVPSFAISLIEGLVAKGKCYSALVQMLGTRSVTERLAQLLVILGELDGERSGERCVIKRNITHEQLANIVGSTRQWVTSTLTRFQKRGIISISRDRMVIERPDLLRGGL